MVMADVSRRGYRVSLPHGHDSPYDMVVDRGTSLARVQVKHGARFKGSVVVKCKSARRKYTASMVDWIAVYDGVTGRCFYVPSSMLGQGRSTISLRVEPTKNNQADGVLWADQFTEF